MGFVGFLARGLCDAFFVMIFLAFGFLVAGVGFYTLSVLFFGGFFGWFGDYFFGLSVMSLVCCFLLVPLMFWAQDWAFDRGLVVGGFFV